MAALRNKRILIFVGDDYEDLELWYPRLRLEEAGAAVVVAGQKEKHAYRGKNGYPCESEAAVAALSARDFDGVVVPGGWMPDKLRRDEHVLRLVREINAAGKLVASICHGPWINISAGIVKGVRMTSTPGIRDDLVNAGAEWVDAPVVVDRHHISSRRPSDLPAFGAKIVEFLASK
ncbi:MAG TPA: type 1 glutamine amidotransferase domain-containing protein [Phycisphaerae bacterium]|nr:type 1 glutamine amidotransferase domain-containing protein [Phycisphaerae bacterium]